MTDKKDKKLLYFVIFLNLLILVYLVHIDAKILRLDAEIQQLQKVVSVQSNLFQFYFEYFTQLYSSFFKPYLEYFLGSSIFS
jgi:hypothetical protein